MKAPSDRWEPALKRIEGVIEQRNHILEEVNKLLPRHRLDRSRLEDMRKIMANTVNKNDIRRFLEIYLSRHGGKLEPYKSEEEAYRVSLPMKMARRIEGSAIVVGTFSSGIAGEKGNPYLALESRPIYDRGFNFYRSCVVAWEGDRCPVS